MYHPVPLCAPGRGPPGTVLRWDPQCGTAARRQPECVRQAQFIGMEILTESVQYSTVSRAHKRPGTDVLPTSQTTNTKGRLIVNNTKPISLFGSKGIIFRSETQTCRNG